MKMQMQGMPEKKSEMVKPEDALKGRSTEMEVDPTHYVLKNPMILEINQLGKFNGGEVKVLLF